MTIRADAPQVFNGITTGFTHSIRDFKIERTPDALASVFHTAVAYLRFFNELPPEEQSLVLGPMLDHEQNTQITHEASRSPGLGMAALVLGSLNSQLSIEPQIIRSGLAEAIEVQSGKGGVHADKDNLTTVKTQFEHAATIVFPKDSKKPFKEKNDFKAQNKSIAVQNKNGNERLSSRRKKRKNQSNDRPPRIFIIQKDDGDPHATLNGRRISMNPFELKVLEDLINDGSFAVASSSPDVGAVKSAVRRIRKITGSSISVKQEGGRRIYSLTTSIDYVTRTKEEIASDEVLRNAQKKNALLKLLESIDDITPEKVNSILDMIPSTRLGRKRKSFKATPQVAQVGFATLIARLTNPNTDAQKLDDSDRKIVGKIFEYLEKNPSIKSLNELNALIAEKFGMKASGYTIFKAYGNYTLVQLKELYKDDEKRVLRTDSIHQDETLLGKYHLYRRNLNKTIRRVVQLFPVKNNSGEESLEVQRFRLGDSAKNQYHMPFSLDFLQALVNNNIFILPNSMNRRVTDRLHLNRAQIAYVLFLKMRQPDEKAKILELPTEAQNALMRIIVHDLPQAIEELRENSSNERVKALSMSMTDR